MALFKNLSKEFQVGALTSIAITILILGYNFMRGKDNPFLKGNEYYVYYDSAQGLGIGTSVIFNGLRIGQLTELDITSDGKKIEAIFELSKTIGIPKDSKMKIESSILGGQKVSLVLGTSDILAEDGDTLIPMYSEDQFSAINEQIVPLASKADTLLTTMNGFFHHPGLDKALHDLPLVIDGLNRLILESQYLIVKNQESINQSFQNVSDFTSNLNSYHDDLSKSLASIRRVTSGLDSIELGETFEQLDSTVNGMNKMLAYINKGKGNMGKLIYDEKLYKDMLSTIQELNRVMLDLKKYPEKYVPVPFTKKQRRKAKEASLNDSAIWQD